MTDSAVCPAHRDSCIPYAFKKTLLPSLSLGKLCEEHGYTYEWASGQKPHLTKDGKKILCKTENYVLLVVLGQSLSSSTSSSSTSPPQDSLTSVNPSNSRSNEESTGNWRFRSRWKQQECQQPQTFLMTQIWNILQKWHQGSTVFMLTSRKTEIAKSASEPR